MPVTWIKQSGQTLLDLIYPPRCVNCEAANSWLCDACLKKVDIIDLPVCQTCGTPHSGEPATCSQCSHHPLKFIDGIRVAAYFGENPIRPAIHALKYRNHKAVAAPLVDLLTDAYRRYNLHADVVVPVPLHKSRYKERGFNQSELLARGLCQRLALALDNKTLVRTKKTKTQMTLGADERHQNVAGAFDAVSDRLNGRRILLIDDVCTTGSTLEACAVALKMSGAATVWGLTLAKAH